MKVHFYMIETGACLNSALKEQKRIAQGFSPGNRPISDPALKGRPSSSVMTWDAKQRDNITPTLRYSNTPRPRIRARGTASRAVGLAKAEYEYEAAGEANRTP